MAAHAAEQAGDPTPGGEEWPALYARYLTRVAGQSARTLELYQQVMDRVARRQLAPTALQDLLASFVQARGAPYNEKLAALGMRFFSGLMAAGTAYSQDLAELVLPGTAESLPPPPRFDASDPARWFQELTDYASRLGAGAVKTYQALLDRVAAGEMAPGRLQQVSSDYLQRRLPEYLRRLGTLYFELLDGLSDLRASHEEDYLSGVLAGVRGPREEDGFVLELVAPLGKTSSASFAVANVKEEPAVLHCTVAEVRRADGVGPGFLPRMTIAPQGLELLPGEEARLELSLSLDEASFEPDVPYVGALYVTGHGEEPLEVPLRITATAAAPTP